MNIALTPEANMDRKISKLSLSQKKKTSVTVAIEVKNGAKEEDRKRKRNLSEGSTTQETPRNKRAKPGNNRTEDLSSEDLAPVENLATNLFSKFSEKLGGSPSRNQKKKLDASISVPASIEAEKSQESTMVTVPEDVGQRLIRELSSDKTASKKRKVEEDGSEVEESIRSPKKTVSKSNDDVESELENNSEENFRSSQKIPSSQKKSKLAKKLIVESKKEGSCSEEEFPSSLKTPMSVRKPKLTKKLDVKCEKEGSSDEDFVSSQKTPSQKKSKLAKKNEEKLGATPAKKTPAKKTPSKPVKEETSHKKSKISVETNNTVTPGKQPKKKMVVEDSDSDVDPEFLIQEMLSSSRFACSPDLTPTAKKVKQKRTPSSKTKLVESKNKSKTPQKPLISTPVSLQVKETKTATSVKKNAKESSSGKSLKALSSEKKQETEMSQEVLSSKKTSSKKPSKTAPPENALDVSFKEKKIKIESTKKRSRPKKDADKEEYSGDEDIVAEILKTVQTMDKKSKSKTKKITNS